MVNTQLHLISDTITKALLVSVTFICIVLSTSAHAAQIEAAIDRNPIISSDSFQLTFTATESPDGAPDFSPLKQDFDILDKNRTSQSIFINWELKETIQWRLTLMAKHTGAIEIPAISFGNDKSSPLAIKVNKSSDTTIESNDELFLEVEVNDSAPYVQSQVIYTVRLYQRIEFSQASISEVEVDDAVVERIGENTQYNTQIKGINYLVTELSYAIFPQKSGEMTIPPRALTAQVIVDNPRDRYSSFFNNQSRQTKRITSKSITMDVQAAPASFSGEHWLPAEQVELHQTWSDDSIKVTVGEPITRTISILAKGVSPSQLPDLVNQDLGSKLKTYPDKAKLTETKQKDGVLSMREQKIAIIPSQAGSFTLPAIDVPWFNTKTKQMEMAHLAEVKLIAIGSATDSEDVAATTPPTMSNAPSKPSPEPEPIKTSSPSSDSTSSLWMWLALLFGLGWLVTLALLLNAKKNTKPMAATAIAKPTYNLNDLKKACTDNNAQSAQQELIKWGLVNFNATTLAELNRHCNATLQYEIKQLNKALYAKETSIWDGSNMYQAVAANQAMTEASKNTNEPLKPLYPS